MEHSQHQLVDGGYMLDIIPHPLLLMVMDGLLKVLLNLLEVEVFGK